MKQLTSKENSEEPSDPQPNMRVNKQAAQRIVKHTIGRQAEKKDSSDPPPKRMRRQ